MADKKGAATFVISLPEYAWRIGKGGCLHLCTAPGKRAAVGYGAAHMAPTPFGTSHQENWQDKEKGNNEQLDQTEVDGSRLKAEWFHERVCGMYNDFATDDCQTEYDPRGGNEEQKHRPEQKPARTPARSLRRCRVWYAFPEEALTRLKRPGRLGIVHKS